MCACMHVYIHVCACMHVYIHVCACMHVYIHVCACIHVYIHVCAHTYVYTCMCARVCIYMYVRTRVYIHICVCTRVYIHICVCTHVCNSVCTYVVLCVPTCIWVHRRVCACACLFEFVVWGSSTVAWVSACNPKDSSSMPSRCCLLLFSLSKELHSHFSSLYPAVLIENWHYPGKQMPSFHALFHHHVWGPGGTAVAHMIFHVAWTAEH